MAQLGISSCAPTKSTFDTTLCLMVTFLRSSSILLWQKENHDTRFCQKQEHSFFSHHRSRCTPEILPLCHTPITGRVLGRRRFLQGSRFCVQCLQQCPILILAICGCVCVQVGYMSEPEKSLVQIKPHAKDKTSYSRLSFVTLIALCAAFATLGTDVGILSRLYPVCESPLIMTYRRKQVSLSVMSSQASSKCRSPEV